MADYMTNSIPENNILYTAQNDKSLVYGMTIFLIILTVISPIVIIFLYPNAEDMNYKLGLIVFVLMFFLVLVSAFFLERRFYKDRIYITSNGILIKQNKFFKSINFGDIELIKQEVVIQTRYTARTNLIIQLKNEETITCMNIAKFEEFIGEIKKIYPSFDDMKCLKTNIESKLNDLKTLLILIIVSMLGFGLKDLGHHFYLNQRFWIFYTLPTIFIIICFIPYYIKLKKKEREQIIKSSP